MTNHTINLNFALYQYMLSISLREPDLLKELRKTTAQLSSHSMQISPEQGQLMALLVELIAAQKTLEIGVYTGYSTLVTALALPETGRITACDINPETNKIAEQFWRKAQVTHKINLINQPAIKTLEHLVENNQANSFDFIFIDADKQNYPKYYEYAKLLARPGGLILIDNVFFGGKVAYVENRDPQTQSIRLLNELIFNDKEVSLSVVPIGDGLTIARKH